MFDLKVQHDLDIIHKNPIKQRNLVNENVEKQPSTHFPISTRIPTRDLVQILSHFYRLQQYNNN